MKTFYGVYALDLITCAKFKNEIFSSWRFSSESNFRLSYWFLHQPYSSACPWCHSL